MGVYKSPTITIAKEKSREGSPDYNPIGSPTIDMKFFDNTISDISMIESSLIPKKKFEESMSKTSRPPSTKMVMPLSNRGLKKPT